MISLSAGLYRSSFSIKSTWVRIMRRQQYLFRPSWSMASLWKYKSANALAVCAIPLVI